MSAEGYYQLKEVKNDLLKWQWFHQSKDGAETYIAGFRELKPAVEYGDRHGWIKKEDWLK